MFKFRKIALALLLIYLISIPAFAFGLSKDSETGAFTFFSVDSSGGTITANSTRPVADMNAAQSTIAKNAKSIAGGVLAICTLTSIFFMALYIVKLAKNADNPNERRKAITGIMVAGVALAGFGGYGVITGTFMNMFRTPDFNLAGSITTSGLVSSFLSGMTGV